MVVGQSQGELIFKKVAVSERKMIFRELSEDRVQIALKGSDHDGNFHLIAIQVEKDSHLLCHHTDDSKGVTQTQKVVLNFNFKNERYFMQTHIEFESGWVVLNIEGDLFQLQRRANARLIMPDAYGATYILTSHEGKKFFQDCAIKDISAGGMKLEVPITHPEFRPGEVLKGSLRLGARRPAEYEVEVRFTQKTPTSHIVGVQFLNVDTILENRLLSLMMDLQRELFIKFPKKT